MRAPLGISRHISARKCNLKPSPIQVVLPHSTCNCTLRRLAGIIPEGPDYPHQLETNETIGLVGEQSNAYRILLRYDRKSRHRRIKKRRRYERLAATSQFRDTLAGEPPAACRFSVCTPGRRHHPLGWA